MSSKLHINLEDLLRQRKVEGDRIEYKKVLKVMKENGSPPPEFETDGDRSYFLIRLQAHPKVESKESTRADTKGKTSEKILTEICNNRNVTIAELSERIRDNR